ncbi:MAG: hypothetical protein QM564_06525 [Bergeyella sp.]
MRLSNRNKASLYQFLSTLLWIFFFGGVALFFIEKYKFDFLGWESYLLIIIPVFMLAIFYVRGRQIFEYDSDGEALNFKNRNVIAMLDKPLSDEFPKYKLLKYEVVNGIIFKRLYITISSKKSNAIILKYDISYLTNKEIKDLKFSLNKVEKANKEYKQANKQNQ